MNPHSIHACRHAALAAVLALAPCAWTQGFVSTQGEVIAASGQAVPGVAAAMFVSSGAFNNAVIDEDGSVLFRAKITGTWVTPFDDRAIFRGSSAADLAILVRGSGPAPGLPGLTLNSSTGQGLGSAVRLGPDGRVLFGSRVNGAGVTDSDDTAFFGGFPGNLDAIVREGDPAPGTVGAVLGSSFHSPGHASTGLNRNGRLLFMSKLVGGDVTGSADDQAWFSGAQGALELLQRKGDVLPGGQVVAFLGPGGQMNDAGQVVHDGTLSTILGSPPATLANDRVVWIWTPTFGDFLILREGDAAPGTSGATFVKPSQFWVAGIGPNAFSEAGDFAMTADLGGGDVVPGVNDQGIFIAGIAGKSMLVRKGDPAPGTDAAFGAFGSSSTSLNVFGEVAIQGALTGGTSTGADDSGIWTGTAGALSLVAREGDPAPGVSGSTLADMGGSQVLFNDAGQVLFDANVFDAATGTSAAALFAHDPVLGTSLALIAGDSIEVAAGTFKTVSTFGGAEHNNCDGAPLSFGHDGSFVLNVTMSDGSQAVVRARIGSLTGVPGAISVASGGAQDLYLNAGSGNAGAFYLLAGSLGGTQPGIPIDAFVFPLNVDAYLLFSVAHPNTPPLAGSFSVLGADGRAAASLTIPPGHPSLAGLGAHHAFGAFLPSGLAFVSEPAAVNFVP